MTKILIALAMFVAAQQSAIAQQTTIRIQFGLDEFDVVTFDQSRVSVDDVKHWMKFAEHGYYGSYGISLSGCKQTDAPRAAKNVKEARRVVDELNHETEYPLELSPVVTYLKRLLLFRLWLGEQYLAFLQTGAVSEPDYQDTDAPACCTIAEHIRNESDRERACQHLGYDWTNCVLKASLRHLGDYPKAQWKAFLGAYGIKEQIESSDNN